MPLLLLFTGTVFTRGATGFAVEQVPWDCEARYRAAGHGVAGADATSYFPNTGWLRLDTRRAGATRRLPGRHGLISWDETVADLLAGRRTKVG